MNDKSDLMQIGKIVGAHGIRGSVKVSSFSDTADSYQQCGDLIIINAEGDLLDHEVEWATPHKKGVRLGLKGITTRNQAEDLIGCGVFIARSSLPLLDADTDYWVDLIGMAVFTIDDEHIGHIAGIIPTGANDVYVVKTPRGHDTDEILLPATASVIVEVDVPGKRMRVNVPDGLM